MAAGGNFYKDSPGLIAAAAFFFLSLRMCANCDRCFLRFCIFCSSSAFGSSSPKCDIYSGTWGSSRERERRSYVSPRIWPKSFRKDERDEREKKLQPRRKLARSSMLLLLMLEGSRLNLEGEREEIKDSKKQIRTDMEGYGRKERFKVHNIAKMRVP